MKITRFEDLECRQQARILVKAVYEATKGQEFRKDLRLSGQIQAAATSSMANLALRPVGVWNFMFMQFSRSLAAFISAKQEISKSGLRNTMQEQSSQQRKKVHGLLSRPRNSWIERKLDLLNGALNDLREDE